MVRVRVRVRVGVGVRVRVRVTVTVKVRVRARVHTQELREEALGFVYRKLPILASNFVSNY